MSEIKKNVCPQCGAERTEGDRYCRVCGARLPRENGKSRIEGVKCECEERGREHSEEHEREEMIRQAEEVERIMEEIEGISIIEEEERERIEFSHFTEEYGPMPVELEEVEERNRYIESLEMEPVGAVMYGPMYVRIKYQCKSCGYIWEEWEMFDSQKSCPKCGGETAMEVLPDRDPLPEPCEEEEKLSDEPEKTLEKRKDTFEEMISKTKDEKLLKEIEKAMIDMEKFFNS